ncbi:MAG: hypothetical protein WCJ62_07480 [Flavobacterium sp.]
MESNEQKTWGFEEFVEISKHIDESKTAFILADTPLDNQEHNVLATGKGTPEDMVTMFVEVMLRHERVYNIIASAYLSYNATIDQQRRNN